MNSVLIIGCGDIGRRLVGLLGGVQVSGVVRSQASAQRLRALGAEALELDLDSDVRAADLPTAGRELYYFAPPPPQGTTDPRVTRICAALRENKPRKVVYISTSAVYGDCGGAWIDESAPLQPSTERGRRRLDAERQWLRFSADTGVPVVILRVPGIYAHDKLPSRRLRQGLPVLAENESPFTNRIHADDLARICLAAMRRGAAGRAYNVSDGNPTSMTDYFNQVADRLGLPRPPTVTRAEAERQLSASMLSFLGESKRLKNTRMLEDLGIELRYPDLTTGLSSVSADDV